MVNSRWLIIYLVILCFTTIKAKLSGFSSYFLPDPDGLIDQFLESEEEQNEDNSKPPKYSYYVFASEWAGSVCVENNCIQSYLEQINPEYFNIHGLWPTTQDGEGPTDNYCIKQQFNPDLISSNTTKDLQTKWSGLFAKSNTFYAHEWQKHGRCWNHHILSDKQQNKSNIIDDFFSTVISIADNISVYSALEKYGIIPNDEHTYNADNISQALTKIYNVTHYTTRCDYSSDKHMLLAIYLCLDLEYHVIDCPVNAEKRIPVQGYVGECRGELYYPPMHEGNNSSFTKEILDLAVPLDLDTLFDDSNPTIPKTTNIIIDDDDDDDDNENDDEDLIIEVFYV